MMRFVNTPSPTRSRAVALPPAERRAHIVAVTLPLILEHGTAVTTRQIAEAAGIAEGTIFGVFPDKDALIDAVVEVALDPAPAEVELRAIDASGPLADRLVEAVDILRRKVTSVFELMSAVGMMSPAGPRTEMATRRKFPELSVLAAVFEPDRVALRRTPLEAAYLLRGLTLVGTHPSLILDEPMSSAEIVDLLLDGVRARPPLDLTC